MVCELEPHHISIPVSGRFLENRYILTIEFVNVAGTAITIHHTMPTKKSLPRPLTKLETSWPSIAATFKLINVLTTKKILWLINNLTSLLLHPGIQIFNNLNKFLKNSLFNSTFGFFPPWLLERDVEPRCLAAACRSAEAFCSEMAERMRFKRAKKRVR
jgi:hypothetical protein